MRDNLFILKVICDWLIFLILIVFEICLFGLFVKDVKIKKISKNKKVERCKCIFFWYRLDKFNLELRFELII